MKMKSSFLLSLNIGFLFTFALALSNDSHTAPHCKPCVPCIVTPCLPPRPGDEVCAKRRVPGSAHLWEKVIFNSVCEMNGANLCGGGYKPCCWFEELERHYRQT